MASLGLIGPYGSTTAFVNELKNHLAIVKTCDSAHIRECWAYDTVDLGDDRTWDISKTKTGKNFKMDDNYDSDNVGIVTADGTAMILSYNKNCEALDLDNREKWSLWSTEDNKPVTNPTAGCVAAVFDYNGAKKPNKLSNDVILFNANGLGMSCAFEVGGNCYGALFSPTPLTKAECEAQKSVLGIKDCYLEPDYWAGAVKQCGGVSNMITQADLKAIADDLYGTDVGSGYKSEITRDDSKLANYGFGGYSGAGFSVWSAQEFNDNIAYDRYFSPSLTSFGDGYRDIGFLAVCKVD